MALDRRPARRRFRLRDADPRQHRGPARRHARVRIGARLAHARAGAVLRYPTPGPAAPRPDRRCGAAYDAAELYGEADYTSLNDGHAARFATFQAYLRRHGILDTFAHGDGGRAFDERIARTPFPGAVTGDSLVRHGAFVTVVERARHRIRRSLRSGRMRRAHVAALRLRARLSGGGSGGAGTAR